LLEGFSGANSTFDRELQRFEKNFFHFEEAPARAFGLCRKTFCFLNALGFS
jgi:hypothetical protein